VTAEETAPRRVPPVDEVFADERLRAAAAAAERGDAAQIRALGPLDIDAVSPSGANLLMYEIAARDETAVRALLAAGANPNHLTPSGASPMLAAGISDDPRWLGILLDHGGDPDLCNQRGEPLLVLLVSYLRWDSMHLLLDRGAAIDATGPSGQTAAFRLAALYKFEQLERLLSRGADPDHPDAHGLTLRVFVAEELDPSSPEEPFRKRIAERLGMHTTLAP
jgi:hypothetical protein